MPTEQELLAQITRLSAELDKRTRRHNLIEPYFERCDGRFPVPPAIVQSRMINAYQHLMGMAETPWGKVIVGSKLDRLEVTGVQSDDRMVDDAVWGVWQDNAMDLESKLGHSAALLDGRCHALVWPDGSGVPQITLDDVTQMIVEYAEGSRRKRVGALRRWADSSGVDHATLYRPDGIYKFRKKDQGDTGPGDWRRRDVDGEKWPLPNPLGIVPVVEIAVNRRLKPGSFAYARGEFEDVTGLMDRINLLTFLGLVVAIWMGFPLRYVIGDKIIRDDDGNAVPPFESKPDSVVQFEDIQTQIGQLQAADRGNLSVFAELTELAAATSTPRHYLPMEGGISNVSEPTIRAFEGGMHATVNASHKPSLGEGWEEVLRLAGLMLDEPVLLSPRASLLWADHESRSLGERADAALKLSQSGLPWQAVADLALNLGQDQIRQFEGDMASTALGQLVAAAQSPAPSEPEVLGAA